MGSMTNKDKCISKLNNSNDGDKNSRSKGKSAYMKLRKKFKNLNSDYDSYKTTVKALLGKEGYEELVRRLRDGREER